MITELRRSKRITNYLPILVNAKNGSTGARLAGPFSGRIIDISEHGACLLMTQVMQNRYHIFHSTREDDARILQITINISPQKVPFTLTAHPVWLDLFRQDQIRAFKMGIQFLSSSLNREQMKQLKETIQMQQKSRGNWWTSHILSGST